MATVCLDGEKIRDWTDFHRESQQIFGFPDFYGANMDAWVDCLSYLRDDDGMTKFCLAADEKLQIKVLHAKILEQRAPDILQELRFCIDGINERYTDYGENAALELILS